MPRHPQNIVNSKLACGDGPLMLEPAVTEDPASSYSVNMSLLLPDVTYLQPAPSRTSRDIKSQAPHVLMQRNQVLPTIPEYPGVSDQAESTCSNLYIKQEVPEFQDVSLFQLLNSDLEQFFHVPHLNSPSLPMGNLHVGSSLNASKLTPQNQCFPQVNQQHGPTYLPPSPPNSEPSSPEREKHLSQNLSPPPSYEASIASKFQFHSRLPVDQGQTLSGTPNQSPDKNFGTGLVHFECPVPIHPIPVQTTPRVAPQSPVLAQSDPFKSNRRTNPDLERRRIHHCNIAGDTEFSLKVLYPRPTAVDVDRLLFFLGCKKVYTKSSHLKAHQRTHTGKNAFTLHFPNEKKCTWHADWLGLLTGLARRSPLSDRINPETLIIKRREDGTRCDLWHS